VSPSNSSGRRPSPVTVAVLLGLVLGIAGVGLALNANSLGPTAGAPSCGGADPSVADPSAPHGAFVLDPPTGPHNAYFSDVESFLVPNPLLCGADFWVPWASVDAGPRASPEYNFSEVDAHAAPWIAAGKEVNLIFPILGESSSDVPQYVTSEVPTVQCGSSDATPVEWNGTFETAYRAFISVAVHHFEQEPGFGYLRFELGGPGLLSPVSNISATGCQAQLVNHGFTLDTWASYLTGMVTFEHSLRSAIQLMVPLSPVYPDQGDNITATVAAVAASDGIGFGSQGLRANESVSAEPGGVGCAESEWCQQFTAYAGVVPLELETAAASSPNGSLPEGALPPLLAVGESVHAQIFELYLDDWLTAFDPNYPEYGEYHVEYADALTQLASEVGTTGG
jgi:hypothetical protein